MAEDRDGKAEGAGLSALTVAGVVIAVLAGLWLLRRLLARVAQAYLARLAAKYRACEICYRQRGTWLANLSRDPGPPIRMCRGCVDAKLGQFAADSMFKNGRLVEDP